MSYWRVTKYSPAKRDGHGHFAEETWTSSHDIGRSFAGATLDLGEYLRVEQAYVDAAMSFWRESGSPRVTATSVETTSAPARETALACALDIAEGDPVAPEMLPQLVRACLRELLWCRLVADAEWEIHFGYDYYMYFAASRLPQKTRELTLSSGLFVEALASRPWE